MKDGDHDNPTLARGLLRNDGFAEALCWQWRDGGFGLSASRNSKIIQYWSDYRMVKLWYYGCFMFSTCSLLCRVCCDKTGLGWHRAFPVGSLWGERSHFIHEFSSSRVKDVSLDLQRSPITCTTKWATPSAPPSFCSTLSWKEPPSKTGRVPSANQDC